MMFWVGLVLLLGGGVSIGASFDDSEIPCLAIVATVAGILLLIGSHYS